MNLEQGIKLATNDYNIEKEFIQSLLKSPNKIKKRLDKL